MTPCRSLAALVASFGLAAPAMATTNSTDYTDLWYIPVESGWGVNVIQQYDIIFSTLFVYDTDGRATWLVAPNTGSVAAPAGQNVFSGPLYRTTGTFYGVPWGGSSFVQVGSITFSFTTPTSGTMSYTVFGTNVSKSIIRQTWRANVMSGNYLGGMTANATNCANGVGNGQALIFGDLTIGHTNTTPTMRVDFQNAVGVFGTCTFSGPYSQDGRLGSIANGSFNCTYQNGQSGNVGTFNMTQIEANTKGITSRFTGTDQFCTYEGFFGGIRDVL